MKDLLTTNEAATLHDVSPATVRSWARRGLLRPAFKVGGWSYYRLADVDEAEYKARRQDRTGRAQKRTT